MGRYRDLCTFDENDKGVIGIDPIKGCPGVNAERPNGCYGLCYAVKVARANGLQKGPGFDTVIRSLRGSGQLRKVRKGLREMDLSFYRIGTMGDPSVSWGHTLNIVGLLDSCHKVPVIITKHWTRMTDEQMVQAGRLKVVLHSSISPLDTPEEIEYRIGEYERYKSQGISVLRIVSCDFNREHPEGRRLGEVQDKLFRNENIIDTPLRLIRSYPLYADGVIKAEMLWDLNSKILISRFNPETFLGRCQDCPDLCGINFGSETGRNSD